MTYKIFVVVLWVVMFGFPSKINDEKNYKGQRTIDEGQRTSGGTNPKIPNFEPFALGFIAQKSNIELPKSKHPPKARSWNRNIVFDHQAEHRPKLSRTEL